MVLSCLAYLDSCIEQGALWQSPRPPDTEGWRAYPEEWPSYAAEKRKETDRWREERSVLARAHELRERDRAAAYGLGATFAATCGRKTHPTSGVRLRLNGVRRR